MKAGHKFSEGGLGESMLGLELPKPLDVSNCLNQLLLSNLFSSSRKPSFVSEVLALEV